MDAAAVLARFDAELRADAPPDPSVERVWEGGVLRLVGAYNVIIWWDFPAEAAADVAAREAAFFAGREVEWKIYSHDRPPGLEAAVAAAGFQPNEAETFLALDLDAGGPNAQSPPGVEVHEVTDESGVADLVRVKPRSAAPSPGASASWSLALAIPIRRSLSLTRTDARSRPGGSSWRRAARLRGSTAAAPFQTAKGAASTAPWSPRAPPRRAAEAIVSSPSTRARPAALCYSA